MVHSLAFSQQQVFGHVTDFEAIATTIVFKKCLHAIAEALYPEVQFVFHTQNPSNCYEFYLCSKAIFV